jgi:Holliday junction resolvase RusA-like endonuclease
MIDFTDPPFACPPAPVVVELAGQPVAKARPRFGNGRAYTAVKTVWYEQALAYAGKVAMKGREPLACALRIEVLAAFEVPASWSKAKRAEALNGRLRPTGRPDFDNIAKTIDALNKIVWNDDSQIVHATISKRYSTHPRLRIEVEAA